MTQEQLGHLATSRGQIAEERVLDLLPAFTSAMEMLRDFCQRSQGRWSLNESSGSYLLAKHYSDTNLTSPVWAIRLVGKTVVVQQANSWSTDPINPPPAELPEHASGERVFEILQGQLYKALGDKYWHILFVNAVPR